MILERRRAYTNRINDERKKRPYSTLLLGVFGSTRVTDKRFRLTSSDAPAAVDVHIVRSAEAPSGCGEPPVPVISPAVVNALAKLTRK